MEELIECEYSFKDRVKITAGFYKGYTGWVEKVKIQGEQVIYSVKLENNKQTLEISEQYLKRHYKFKLPFMK